MVKIEFKLNLESLKKFCRKRWYLIVLLFIFLLSLHIRLFTAAKDWLLAFDPYFHFRYTKYIVEKGFLPSWDPMSYYPPGRPLNHPPLMHYLTAYLYKIFGGGMSLMDLTKNMAAVYGAIATIPAFFLAKEFSDWKAGLIASVFIGTSGAVLSRSMAGFYDTDGLVVFFTLLTMYLLVRAFKRKKLIDYTFATLGIILFALTWPMVWYVPIIVIMATVSYFILLTVLGKREWREGKNEQMPEIGERFNKALKSLKETIVPLLVIFAISSGIMWLLGYTPYDRILSLISFTSNPSQVQIVNVSVAELQNLSVFGGAWKRLFSELSIPLIFAGAGSLLLLRRDLKDGAILLTWLGITFYSITKGVRFMLVFAPAAAIAGSVAISEAYKSLKDLGDIAPLVGFAFLASIFVSLSRPSLGIVISILTAVGVLMISLFWKKESEIPSLSKPLIVGVAIIACLITVSQATQVASQQTQRNPLPAHWKNAYFFLKNETAQDSVVGTWWDPGHRIAGVAERRNIADGAHCPDKYCEPGLNTRITHLGKIFVTSNESEAVNLLTKYRGNASEMYWIASQDLIGKFRWLQYFGTGCDGTGILTSGGQQKCPLYSQMRIENQQQNKLIYKGGVVLDMTNQTFVPKIQNQGREAVFERMLMYQNGEVNEISFKDEYNNTIDGTLWVHPQFSFVVYIPPHLEDSMFTKMFFREGEGLDKFDRVFRNSYVKIYKLNVTSSG
ncbi:MAG: STT3 domain-containing protein [Candidatus Aenigmatarchaeota archaeon]